LAVKPLIGVSHSTFFSNVEILMQEITGWTKYMEWKYPVHIEITNPGLFKGIGAVEAAASL
jgi:hypothetical protein